MNVTLAEGATALIWDSFASGRVARGERWAFEALQNEIQITTSSGGRLLERAEITPTRGRIGLASPYDYVASFFVVSDATDRATWISLREDLADLLDSMGGDVLGGVTEPPVQGLAAKLVAGSAEGLAAAQDALWQAVRFRLFGLARPELRRY
jgi:urease accessory protein